MELFQQKGTRQKSAPSVDESKLLLVPTRKLPADNDNIDDDGNIHVWPDKMQYVNTYLIL